MGRGKLKWKKEHRYFRSIVFSADWFRDKENNVMRRSNCYTLKWEVNASLLLKPWPASTVDPLVLLSCQSSALAHLLQSSNESSCFFFGCCGNDRILITEYLFRSSCCLHMRFDCSRRLYLKGIIQTSNLFP